MLGNVVSSGVKVLVLAVIIGIGSTLFAEFTQGFGGNQPTIEDAMAIVLAALSLLGLGIFGPGIANGLISGGPQLGAGAAVGTGLAAGGMVAAGAAGMGMATGAASGALTGAARGGAAIAGGASASYGLASAGKSGAAGVAAGIGGVAQAGAGAAMNPLKRAASKAADSMKESYRGGARGAVEATGGTITGGATTEGGAAASSSSAPPAWAKAMKRSQAINHGASAAAHAVRSGDSHGGGTSINLSEGDR